MARLSVRARAGLLAVVMGTGAALANGQALHGIHGGSPGALPAIIRSPALASSTNDASPAQASPDGALSFTMDFQPNGDGIEVDAPAGVAFSPDGQYVLVPAAGKAPGMSVLSVYQASDLSPVRTIPLTHAPKIGFALMRTQPRAVLVNPGDDTVSVVDYAAGVELAVIPVGDLPSVVSISQDDTTAVVQGSVVPFEDLHDVSWSVLDLATNLETSRFDGPIQMGGMTGISAYGISSVFDAPVFRPAGDEVATLLFEYPDLLVSVVNIETQLPTSLPIATEINSFGRMVATPDGSMIALGYQAQNLDVRVVVIDTADWAVQDFFIRSAPLVVFSVDVLLRPDGSQVAISDGLGAMEILNVADGAIIPVDTSGFDFSSAWSPVANLGGGTNFLVWAWGGGDIGYQIFDWEGNRAAELIATDLSYADDVFTQMVATSPTQPFHTVLTDATATSEDLALLDLDPANPQMLVHSALGDGGIEGDAASKVLVSEDESTALVFDPQSSNAFFLDLETNARQWVETPKYASDAALVPAGETALFVAGTSSNGNPMPGAARLTIVDRSGGAPVDLPLPADAYANTLAIDAAGDYAYTLLGYIGGDSELARIDLATRQIDPARLPVPSEPTFLPYFNGFNSDVLFLQVAFNDSRRWLVQSHSGSVLAVASGSLDGSSTQITLIDKPTWSVLTSIELGPVRARAQIMEFSADDSRLYVGTEGAMSVIAIDRAQSELVQQRTIDRPLTDFALSPDGTKLYLGVWPDLDFGGGGDVATHGIRVWSASGTMLPITSYQLPISTDFGFPATFWPELNMPTRLWRSSDDSRVYVFSLNDEVHAIDPATDQLVASGATGFLSPTSVARLSPSAPGEDRFLMTSFNGVNDGVAALTIRELQGDVIFQDGFD